MNSNEPAGASQDSRNPTHEDKELCRYCDQEEIFEIAVKEVKKKYGKNYMINPVALDEYLKIIDSFPLCKQCFIEEQADMRDDL